ncbi:MAG: hypothetical protein HYU26_05545 [Candidatus Rokubacteria bacterium]|nr:hypothetical protein [Candidatus Rokubacteria bacterium]
MRLASLLRATPLLLALAGPPAIGGAAELPAGAEALHAKLAAGLQPSVRSWVEAEGRKAGRSARAGTFDAAAVRAAAHSRFAGQTVADMDIEALVMLVMMQAARDAEEDLKAIMAEMKAANAAKQKLRDLIGKVSKDVAQNAGKRDGDPCRPPQCGVGRAALAEVQPALAAARARVAFAQQDVATIRDLRALQDELKGKLDSMNEMSEITSLRLQMMIDRRSKFISTLSSIMKRISDTQDTLVQNLK